MCKGQSQARFIPKPPTMRVQSLARTALRSRSALTDIVEEQAAELSPLTQPKAKAALLSRQLNVLAQQERKQPVVADYGKFKLQLNACRTRAAVWSILDVEQE
eukprot:comp8396_c0_seq1/m.3753 comp8396_c0_seq1/g.3753  ORF comp8396_c0_seq1/g.3753 comp8396_c0_seq1/m.3753 type:complete len:103 (-) comp8396_c0_seq1:379-687(-)